MTARQKSLLIGLVLVAVLLLALWFVANSSLAPVRVQIAKQSISAIDRKPLSDPNDQGPCFGGCPAGAPPDDVVVTHHILVLANNPHTKFADWVAYQITVRRQRLWPRIEVVI